MPDRIVSRGRDVIDTTTDVAGDVVDTTTDVAGGVVDRGRGVVDTTTDVAGGVIDRGRGVVDTTADVAGGVVDRGGEVVDTTADFAAPAIDPIAGRARVERGVGVSGIVGPSDVEAVGGVAADVGGRTVEVGEAGVGRVGSQIDDVQVGLDETVRDISGGGVGISQDWTTMDDVVGPHGVFGEEGISPSARMSLSDEEAIEARAEQEQDILGWAEIEDVGDVPGAAVGGLFAVGQGVEQAGVRGGEAVSNLVPSAQIGPRVGEEHVGEVPANIAGGTIAFGGMGIGAVAQLPGSAAADVGDMLEGEETPTEVQGTGSSVATFGRTQFDMVTDYPMSTVAGFALPGAPRTVRSLERGAGDAGVTTPRRPTVQRIDLGETSGITVGATRQRGRVTETDPGVSVFRDPVEGTRVETGTPEVPLEGIFGERGSISGDMTAAEAGIFSESLRGAGRADEATIVESYRGVQTETQRSGLRPESAEGVVGDVLESQSIPREAAPGVTDLIAAEEGQLYGSVVQRASAETIGEPGVARTPRDIDIGGLESSTRFAREAEQRINELAGEPVVTREGAAVRSRETGEELFDLHEVGEIAPEGSASIFGRDADRFGVREDPTVRTQEGVETTTLPEQTRRKGMGATETITREPGEVGPIESMIRPTHEGRVKDIPDFYVGERANIEALRQQGRAESAQRAEVELESFVEAFGEDVAARSRSEYEAAVAGEVEGPREQIADFAEPEASPGVFGDGELAVGPSAGVFGAAGSPAPLPGGSSGSFGIGEVGQFDVTSSPAVPGRIEGESPGLFGDVEETSVGIEPDVGSPSPEPASMAPDVMDSMFPADGEAFGSPVSAPVDVVDSVALPPADSSPISPFEPGEVVGPPSSPFGPDDVVGSPSSPFADPQGVGSPFSPYPASPDPEPTHPPRPIPRPRGDGGDEDEWFGEEELEPETPLFWNPIADVWPPGRQEQLGVFGW